MPSNIDENATIKFAFPSIGPTLDPHLALNFTFFYMETLYDFVLGVDANRNLRPGLAEKYSVETNPPGMILNIRKGVSFADGTPADANAVKASLDRGRTLSTSLVKTALSAITTIDVIDQYTVRLNLNKPDSILPYALADLPGAVINPKAIAAGTLATKTDGTTPYQVVENTTNRIVIERRPGATYWDPASWKWRRLEITAVPNQDALVNGLKTGTFDVSQSITILPLDQLKASLGSDFVVREEAPDSGNVLMLRNTRPAVADVAVRQAIAKGWDRASLVKIATPPFIYASQLFPKGHPAYTDNYDSLAFDPNAAKAVLQGRGMKLKIGYGTSVAFYKTMAEAFQQNMKDVGVDVDLTGLANTALVTEFNAGNYDGIITAQGAKADGAAWIEDVFFGSFKLSGSSDAALRPKLEAVRAAVSLADRDPALRDLAKAAWEDATYIKLGHSVNNKVFRKNITGISSDDSPNPFVWSGVFSWRYVAVSK